MLSEEDYRRSRSELQHLINSVNKSKKSTKVKRTPKFRFKALVRTVINNLKWLLEETTADSKVSSKHPKLSTEGKGLLRIPVEERTQEEKEMLSKLLGQLQAFERYPENVGKNLTAAAMFAYFPPGRVLVAEGHPSVAMYFIISGQVSVSKQVFDPGLKKFKSVDVATMSAGEAFGEINILHDEPWPTTVTTINHIEILTVLKEHFQSILEEFLGEQKRQVTNCLKKFSYFKDWNYRTVFECCILARIVEFEDDVLILGDNCGDLETSYFVVSGNCRVIYHLQLEEVRRGIVTELKVVERQVTTQEESFPFSDTVKGVERIPQRKLPNPFITGLIVDKLLQKLVKDLPITETRLTDTGGKMTPVHLRSHFVQIATLMPGACFGIGESLENKFILSTQHPVVILCIPKFFLKFHNFGNIWGRVREFFNHIYPSPQTIFNEFIMTRKWEKSRKKYLESLIKDERPFTGLTQAEAPYYSRLTTDLENPIFRRIKTIMVKRER